MPFSSHPVSPQLATVKMLYTASNFAQPTKPKLPNLTFTELTYPIKPTKTNKPYYILPNQIFAKHTYWTKPFKRSRLNQIYSIHVQELKHSRKKTNSTPGSVEPLKSLAMMVVVVVGDDGDHWQILRTFLWLGSHQFECFMLPLAAKKETWTSLGRHIVSCLR